MDRRSCKMDGGFGEMDGRSGEAGSSGADLFPAPFSARDPFSGCSETEACGRLVTVAFCRLSPSARRPFGCGTLCPMARDSHDHDHPHDHHHGESRGVSAAKLKLAVILTLTFVGGEAAAGLVS